MGKYSIRKSKNQKGRFDLFLSGFVAMYCATYDTKDECRTHIKNQKKFEKEINN